MSSFAEPHSGRNETRRVREILFVTGIVASILWGCAATGAVLAGGGALGHLTRRTDVYFFWLRFVAAGAGLSVATIRIWRRRNAGSLASVALWIEERVPKLDYALVSVLDASLPADSAMRGPLESMIEKVNLPEVALKAAVPAYVRAAAAVLVVAVLLSRVVPLHATDVPGASAPPAPERVTTRGVRRLAGLRAHIVPPAYAHEAATDVADPSTISALAGSQITLRGPGAPDGLGAPVPVRADGGGWAAELTMPHDAAALRFTDGDDSRVVALIPTVDAPPIVLLELPAADTTYVTPPRTIVLTARATDDIGLADGWFECIVSTGQSEGNFKSATDTVGRVTFADTRSGMLRATLTIPLVPGSQLSIRAVARDGNTVTGPGIGSSDTRTLRIASREEYDSLAVAAAAPPPILDKALMSQRMLVMQTESLVARHQALDHAHYVSESVRLSGEQERLRQEVDDILNAAPAAADSEGEPGEREDVDASKGAAGSVTGGHERGYFQAAYQAMTDAARSLAVGLPDTALPSERKALAALDSARVTNRLYLRGAPPTIVVNTARVRLAGPPGGPTADTAAPAYRTPGPRADSLRAVVLRYIEEPAPAPDSLSLLQIAATSADPTLAAALGDAAAVLRTTRDSTQWRAALLRVRRVAAPRPTLKSGLGP